MSYKEYLPSAPLSGMVDCYWSSYRPPATICRILPDGCIDLIFNIGGAVKSLNSDNFSRPAGSSYFTGMMTTFSQIELLGSSSLFAIRFKTAMLSRLTRVPLWQLKNRAVEAAEIIPYINKEHFERVAALKNDKDRIQYLEKELLKLLYGSGKALDKRVDRAINLIRKAEGLSPLDKLSYHCCLSLRQLERLFKEQVGLTIKEYSTFIRYRSTLQLIEEAPGKSLLEIAHLKGYYDHAHLTNSFKKITGRTPRQSL